MTMNFNNFQCIIFSGFQFNSEQKLDDCKIWARSNSLGGTVCEMIELVVGELQRSTKRRRRKGAFYRYIKEFVKKHYLLLVDNAQAFLVDKTPFLLFWLRSTIFFFNLSRKIPKYY